jgi:hypothetical protein
MTVVKKKLLLAFAAILLVAGCGSSRQRLEGILQLEKLQTDVHGLQILVSAGVTKQEYSQRFEDTLLKLGDLGQREALALPKFPQKEQPTVKAIYEHLSKSIAAYKTARNYFGEKFDNHFCEEGCSFFREDEFEQVKQEFPSLAHLDFGPENTWYRDGNGNVVNHSYRRSDMLHALWSMAAAEDNQASQLTAQLTQD